MTGRALKSAETVDGALAPALTKADLKILRAVPASVPFRRLMEAPRLLFALTPWEVAEAAREDDVQFVRAVLWGLRDRRLVDTIGCDSHRSRQRWIRTMEGDRRAARA